MKRWAHLQRQGITAVRLAAAFGRGAKGSGFFLPAPDGLTVRAPGTVVGAILLLEDIAKSLGHIDRPLATVIRAGHLKVGFFPVAGLDEDPPALIPGRLSLNTPRRCQLILESDS